MEATEALAGNLVSWGGRYQPPGAESSGRGRLEACLGAGAVSSGYISCQEVFKRQEWDLGSRP